MYLLTIFVLLLSSLVWGNPTNTSFIICNYTDETIYVEASPIATTEAAIVSKNESESHHCEISEYHHQFYMHYSEPYHNDMRSFESQTCKIYLCPARVPNLGIKLYDSRQEYIYDYLLADGEEHFITNDSIKTHSKRE